MIKHAIASTLALLTWMAAPHLCPAVDFVWVEGENPSAGGVGLSTNHVYVSRDPALSGGTSFGGDARSGLFIEYELDAPSEGTYQVFVRRFWNHGPFRWRVGTGEWKELGKGTLLENLPIGAHCISWLPAGSVQLAKGQQTLRIEPLSDKGPFVIDCIAFVKGPFNPTGALKPGEKHNKAEPGTWAFEPDADDYRPDALNLRALNEPVAGVHGYIGIDGSGDFVDGRGQPIRFWAVNTGVQGRPGTEDLAAHAKHLAKRGVNMVRHFGHLNPASNGGRGPTPRPEEIDSAQKVVAIMKKEGIYTTVTPYWAGFNGAAPQTALFWDKSLQSNYKAWVKELLTKPNPYDADKTPLGRDPALAVFQIQNEDSMFFWTTMAMLKDEPLRQVTALYHDWRQRNGMPGTPALDFRFFALANATSDHRDTMRFFAELQRDWNTEVERFIRDECGSKVLVNAGNWRTADQQRLLDLERWSYDANAVIANNRYVTGVHVNPTEKAKSGYLVSVGDLFTDDSKTIDWASLTTNARQVAGKPYIVTESTWVPPMSHTSEGPLLVAAYSALTGVDAYYWFALGQVGYDTTINKWQSASPSVMGGWPAAAFLFRNGLVGRGKPAVYEERAMEDLWELRPPLLREEAGYDPNRDAKISPRSNVKTAVDPAAYLVGPVEVKYGGDPAKSAVADVASFVDKSTGKINSNTRELTLDPRTGLCTVNAPAAQGATGFLGKAGVIKLDTLTIDARNDYATVVAVSLDRQPLATSKRVLVQITTQHRPYGWRQSPTTFKHEGKEYNGFRIDSLGGPPWNVSDTDLTLSLTNETLTKVTRLDENLYPTGDVVESKREGRTLRIKPPRNTMYLLAE